jgi:SGNH hydrolase-like domain, acetyltransferase AlgX
VLLIGALLPLLQHILYRSRWPRLYGKYTATPHPSLTLRCWFSGDYWEKESNYLNDSVGFRAVLIRSHNQLQYSLFGNYPFSLCVGPGKDLFYWTFIFNYSGRDFIGIKNINTKVMKLKAVQDTLERLGKKLVFVHAPCKAWYYPEDLPEAYRNNKHNATNYMAYVRAMDSMGINFMDFNKWFIDRKGTTKDLLFTRQGIHWSVYGAMVSADTFASYMRDVQRTDIAMPVWQEVVHSSQPRQSDDDIAQCFNFIFPYEREQFTYPVVSFRQVRGRAKPRALYIGDSFFIAWITSGFIDSANSEWHFLYYFKDVWARNDEDEGTPKRPMLGDEWLKMMDDADYVVLMYSASNLKDLGNGFVEKAYDHFYPRSRQIN